MKKYLYALLGWVVAIGLAEVVAYTLLARDNGIGGALLGCGLGIAGWFGGLIFGMHREGSW